jgi:SAM-dependent methyltransferase
MNNPIQFEPVVCNLCGASESNTILNRGDLNTTLAGIFTLVRCNNCGLVYQNPRPAKASWGTIYPPEYDQYVLPLQAKKSLAQYVRQYGLEKRIKFVQKYKSKGRLLDVGCATGDFLQSVSQNPNWEALGLEPNPEASQAARSVGLNVITGSIEDLRSYQQSFDVITLWNVIEHLADPKGSLQILNQLLRPGGILVVTTPDIASLDARLFGPYWIGFELPRHFFCFSASTLGDLFKRAGFQTIDRACFYGAHAAFMSSFRFWLRGRFHNSNPDFLFSLPVRVLLAPFFFVEEKLNLSSSMTLIGKKIV